MKEIRLYNKYFTIDIEAVNYNFDFHNDTTTDRENWIWEQIKETIMDAIEESKSEEYEIHIIKKEDHISLRFIGDRDYPQWMIDEYELDSPEAIEAMKANEI